MVFTRPADPAGVDSVPDLPSEKKLNPYPTFDLKCIRINILSLHYHFISTARKVQFWMDFSPFQKNIQRETGIQTNTDKYRDMSSVLYKTFINHYIEDGELSGQSTLI